jgi:hypothetical protein
VLNLQTAKAIDLKIAKETLLRVDQVFERAAMRDRQKITLRPYIGGIRHRLMIYGLILLGTVLVLSTFDGSIYTRKQIHKSTVALQTEIASASARQIHHS